MFSSKFREGLAHHDSTSPILIPLLEDEGDALVVVCNALHYRKEATTEEISMEVLIKSAVLCDKYNMGNSLLTWSSRWLDSSARAATCGDLEASLNAARLFDVPRAFHQIS